MKLQAHFIADTAQFDTEGFFTVIRGGMDMVYVPTFPALLRFSILTRVWLTPDEAEGLVEMATRMTFNGKEFANTRQPLNVNRTQPARIFINAVSNVQMGLTEVGLIQIEAGISGRALPLLELPISRPPGS